MRESGSSFITKNKIMFLLIALTSLLFSSYAHAEKTLIQVNIALLEAFSQDDTSSTVRYRFSYLNAIKIATEMNRKKLSQCGYALDYIPFYYNEEDFASIQEKARKINSQNIWFVIGPLKSDDFLLAKQVLKDKLMVSTLANSELIYQMPGSAIFLMTPKLGEITQKTVSFLDKQHYGQTYGAFIDAGCHSCKDFSASFDQAANGRLNKKFEIKSVSETPDLTQLKKQLTDTPVDFLLLPNYSRFSAYVMTNLHEQFPNLKYVGSDGWGEENWSYFHGFNLPNSIEAIELRQVETKNNLVKYYHVDTDEINWENKKMWYPTASINLILFINQFSNDLCKLKPANSSELYKALKTKPVDYYKPTFPIGVFYLHDSKMQLYESNHLTRGGYD